MNGAVFSALRLRSQPDAANLKVVMVELKPETERLVQEEIRSGHFHAVDQLILQGVTAWREKHRVEPAAVSPERPLKSLFDLLTQTSFRRF